MHNLIFTTLAFPGKSELDTLLLAYEAALDSGDQARISAYRQRLAHRVDEVGAQLDLELPR